MTRIRHSSSGIVQLVIRRAEVGQRADSKFFTTWDTLERAQWRAEEINGLLQIRPSPYYGFRPFVQEFHAVRVINIARSISRANPEYGPGGGEKLFIPGREHAAALVPVGELVVLSDSSRERDVEPDGFLKSLIDLEISFGNSLVGSDREKQSGGQRRFWIQAPLHIAEIKRVLKVPDSLRWFEDRDIYGDTAGYVSESDRQVVVAPLQHNKSLPPKLWNRLIGALIGANIAAGLRRMWPST